ncbi:conserved hypothetical protein [groundwater metagenome]|uniref:Amidohydrolase-related domain-containing protein n=1 Tax=groundwater metagenome TaxID=717931 RepID=A0A098EDW4_9ZZZZ
MLFNCSFIDKNFEIIEEGNLVIENGKISECNEGYVSDGRNFKNFVVMPSLINAHTHIGDSFTKDAVQNLNAKECCGKNGSKWKFYKKASQSEISDAMKDSCLQMLDSGISTFVDFREFEMNGVEQLKKVIKNIWIKAKILARDVRIDDIDYVDGLGLNLYNLKNFETYEEGLKYIKTHKKIFALHAGEAKDEISEVFNLKILPDIIIHFLNPSEEQIKAARRNRITIVLCPRSNAILKCGIPNLRQLTDAKINVCLGTDNVMLNSPDLWAEMEFAYKISSLHDFVEPKEILKTVTINPAKALNLNAGIIDKGKVADIIFISKNSLNLKHSKNLITSLVNRCKSSDVSKVMIEGKFVKDL